MQQQLSSPEEAYANAKGVGGFPEGMSTPFVCPHCQSYAQHLWGYVIYFTYYLGGDKMRSAATDPLIASGRCQVCSNEVVFIGGKVVYPSISSAPMPTADMPAEVFDDFMEARAILGASPRGAAALLRLVIQKLCPILGATKPDINQAIGELVQAGTITPSLQQALDTVRVVGNEAVHPGTIDFRDDPSIAGKLFRIVNFIVEKGITEPKQIAEIYADLPPAKLAGIAQRDQPKKTT